MRGQNRAVISKGHAHILHATIQAALSSPFAQSATQSVTLTDGNLEEDFPNN